MRYAEGERRLYQAILLQASQDATRKRPTGKYSLDTAMAVDAARGWFQEAGDDFRYVCEMAGRDPFDVLRRIMPKVRAQEAQEIAERDARLAVSSPSTNTRMQAAQRLLARAAALQAQAQALMRNQKVA